ncbi:dTDP-4-dehydrorhamnose 3,5-epimerase-like enzyme [Clostridium beijerinckii]|uniref:dTDP-4-keto-6-deoxy-D-glucose epimerase n=1 Tax=Clostridium beijerinckii TaxID=1520 RepID=A0AAW3W8N1_CLOBE|nr:dTDP-4-keto-6-deoxy-D-glucose epimerase [Clostridium beijerinckii]MBC2474932.1 dTDP-4-keto-6-deoxy-D-glucose epimerase [Clostridium beijerinckii]NOV60172.1 dTDP-4-dehydrorhamnose 3,5-epimerase-like enzyme [Clostridium beijerinckii]NOV71051.1 dTDP-4-dehydrorhamnose 3,5-epimerase-like enzyme [Clostridium beijerinckii]NOW33970.1 dTDP-4-dehydrorhamnose 3,5-epimerase-like enzyme [Clostridium beijerinckii]
MFNYKDTDFYEPKYEDGIKWNNPNINIAWPLDKVNTVILSEKDKVNIGINEIDLCEYPDYNI